MKVFIDERARHFLESLETADKARALRYLELLREYGLSLSEPFLKKLSPGVWELRPGNVRLLFGRLSGDRVVIVHGFKKQSAKTPKKELSLAEGRLSDGRS